MSIEPHLPIPRPSTMLAVLGGVIGTLLLSALMYLSPLLGFPFIDYPHLIGGAFTVNPDTALWLGYGIFFLFGVLIFPTLLAFLWPFFPGHPIGIVGPLTKGAVWGAILWVISGLVGGIFGGINQLSGQEFQNPGFFMLNAGILAAIGNLLGHVLYVIAMILVTSMGQGINPMDTLGWTTYHNAEAPELVRGQPQDLHDQKSTAH